MPCREFPVKAETFSAHIVQLGAFLLSQGTLLPTPPPPHTAHPSFPPLLPTPPLSPSHTLTDVLQKITNWRSVVLTTPTQPSDYKLYNNMFYLGDPLKPKVKLMWCDHLPSSPSPSLFPITFPPPITFTPPHHPPLLLPLRLEMFVCHLTMLEVVMFNKMRYIM